MPELFVTVKNYLYDVLGPRLTSCCQLVKAIKGRSIEEIFGGVDSLKFRSSMTLFAHVAPPNSVFAVTLRKYFDGRADPETLSRLGCP